MKIERVPLPIESTLSDSPPDYTDSFRGTYFAKDKDITTTDIGRAFFASAPKWVAALFKMRNVLVSLLGLKTSGNGTSQQETLDNFTFDPGDRLGLFKIYSKTNNEIILGEDDKHLDFRVALLREQADESQDRESLTISTIVNFNSNLGKLYFAIVKPFHRLIVPIMLKGIIRHLDIKPSK